MDFLSTKIFPKDITYEECHKIHEENQKLFTERVRDGIIIFNYKMGNIKTFPDPFPQNQDSPKNQRECIVRREMRGLLFSEKTKKLICRAYHKFFNINELDETDLHFLNKRYKLNTKAKYTILEKLDGAFVSGVLMRNVDPIKFKDDDSVILATKTGISNKQSKKANKLFINDEKISSFIKFWCQKGFTPIFEFIDKDKIRVIKYKESKLIVTAIRKISDGSYVSYEDMVKSSEKFGVQCCKEIKIDVDSKKDGSAFEIITSTIRKMKDVEGYCMRFENGEMFKIKTLFYLKTGKGNSDLAIQEHFVWKLILNTNVDDFKSNCAKDILKKRIDAFSVTVMDKLNELNKKYQKLITGMKKNNETIQNFLKTNKEAESMNMLEKNLLRMLYNYEEDDYFEKIKRYSAKQCNYKQINNLRKMFDDIRFY